MITRSTHTLRRLITALAIALTMTVTLAPTASAAPPNIPSASTAHSQLVNLIVAQAGSTSGYSRARFPHWITISGSCNTRETALKRDGSNVRVNSSCYPTSGSWHSPYDGATSYSPTDVDIDHIVPLAEAWRSGARNWTDSRRQSFANDLDGPELITVTDNVNSTKGDQPPNLWKPPLTSYWCTYARMWIGTKSRWTLTVTSAEKSALLVMLARC